MSAAVNSKEPVMNFDKLVARAQKILLEELWLAETPFPFVTVNTMFPDGASVLDSLHSVPESVTAILVALITPPMKKEYVDYVFGGPKPHA